MYASGEFGRNFGRKRLAAILKVLPDVLNWDKGQTALIEAVDNIEGFDRVTAQQFAKRLPAFRAWLRTVPSITWTLPKLTRRIGNALANHQIVMTGFRDAALTKEIEQQGGAVIDSIKRATILLAKDPNGSSSKLDTARQLKIPIMTVEEFRRKFNLKG
jgi:NAD-dependent DNA ligase